MNYIIDSARSDAQLIAARYLADKESQAKQAQRVNMALYLISLLIVGVYLLWNI